MTMKRTWTFALLAAALTVTVASSSLVLGKGKPPKDDPPPPDPPPVTYQITWVEVPGNSGNYVRGINNAGVAVGRTNNADATIYYAFRYSIGGGMDNLNSEIDPNSGWDLTEARGINDSGQIVGVGWINGEERAFRYRPAGSDDGVSPAVNTVDDLGKLDPSHVYCQANAINNSGEVCGYSIDAFGLSHAFYYSDASGLIEIAAGADATAGDINNTGQVVGKSRSDNTAFRYSPATQFLETFESPDGNQISTSAGGINDSGQFVGGTQFSAPKGKNKEDKRAFRYTDGLQSEFENLGAGQGSSGVDINSSGDVVILEGFLGFVYLEQHSALVNLDDAVTGPEAADWLSALNKDPRYINDSGQITGHVSFGYGLGGRGFILTPIPASP
ncbi:hypothetical protein [Symmachiella dynata]|uniref:hypothetical protein n=1 Tax=Symmachiella dynata TaxID=2527995 RepID=UPI0030EC0EF4|tara:strand:- start:840 stop:2000 length:1161 start_codon:yes stop_codon:yes gene_type:complete